MFKRTKQRNALVKTKKMKFPWEKIKPSVMKTVKVIAIELASGLLLKFEKRDFASIKNGKIKFILPIAKSSSKELRLYLNSEEINPESISQLGQNIADEHHGSDGDAESKIALEKKHEIITALKKNIIPVAKPVAKWALEAGVARLATLTFSRMGAIALPTGAVVSLPVVFVAGGVMVLAGGTWYYLSNKSRVARRIA